MIRTSKIVSVVGGGSGGSGGGGGGDGGDGGDGDGAEADETIEENLLGATRWPRQETLALLRVRLEMDSAFREPTTTSTQLPIWEQVSRKMGEIGYHRTGKDCEEKFKNLYSSHKRTRDVRSGQWTGKIYRFFEQLEVFDNQTIPSSTSSKLNEIPKTETTIAIPLTATMATRTTSNPTSAFWDPTIVSPTQDPMLCSTSTTSTSERESEGSARKKRRMADYFQRFVSSVLQKQEDLQNKFLEAVEKCTKERMAREEAWRAQEMARIKREKAILARERAEIAANYAAVVSCLQKLYYESSQVQTTGMPAFSAEQVENLKSLVTNSKVHVTTDKGIDKQDNLGSTGVAPLSVLQVDKLELLVRNNVDKVHATDEGIDKQENGMGESSYQGNSLRWPKEEVEVLVRLRLLHHDPQFLECGPKGHPWEAISLAMKKLGYARSAKKCREKWENINKYYRKMKDANKKGPEDPKRCPYFNLLESFGNKSKTVQQSSDTSGCNPKPEDIAAQMISQQQQQKCPTEECESEDMHQDEGNTLGEDDEVVTGDCLQSVAVNPSAVAILE